MELDKRLESYFQAHSAYVQCKAGCSACCEKGDYPLSQIELEYVMQGFVELDNEQKRQVQANVKSMTKGGICPFLINNICSIYAYRPIVCRVHGLAYLCKDKTVKLPYCATCGKNYSSVYKNGEIVINPVLENLDTPNILSGMPAGEIRNLYNWIKP